MTPNIDLALDRCLIAFNDDGALVLSSSLTPTDADALGLRQGMRLRFVRSQLRQYLTYHRKMFNRREEALAAGRTRRPRNAGDDDLETT